jgi:hypothetical protein
MPIIVQASTLAGKMIEGARWEVEFPSGVQEGHLVALNLPFKDSALNGYLARSPSSDCMVDKNSSGYSVALSLKVTQVRHMVEVVKGEEILDVESMAIIIPVNRLVEHVLMYLIAPSKCDQKFVLGVRGTSINEVKEEL